MKNNELTLQWDKEEQTYAKRNSGAARGDETNRDVERYFDFLSDVEPLSVEPTRRKLSEKQFTF
jgi:hypothetical protein